ncbi:MAG: HD domain-containing protein [Candidatus Omnitrophica bacterium]|nr:HD domain-containing protein [Candidatus Omnitrophota bacterium]MDD5488012.1 HD domain-containing protein [Candidatus Omnitrophota bacterium]
MNISIRTKLFATTISILVLAVTSTAAINITKFRSMYIEAMLERARADAQDIRSAILHGLNYFPLDSFSDMRYLLRSRLSPKFSYCYVANADRKILYHSEGDVDDDKLPDIFTAKLELLGENNSIIVSVEGYYESVIPIVFKEERVGTIHVGIEKNLVDGAVIRMIAQTVTILIIALLASIFVLYYLLTKNITEPIRMLLKKVTYINSRFDITKRIKEQKGDELAAFARSFDLMSEELQIIFEGSINALATAVESRDPYTAGHQRRVADLARTIAKEMGLPEKKQNEIYMSGISHDIGKVGVPTRILTKRGKLTEEEIELIRSHPQVGYDILKAIDFDWPIARTVLQHHEHMDGTGYPNGANGDNILLEARIITVADVVEAMAAPRPYREGLGIEAALDEILLKRDTWFDPKVVDTCLKLFYEQKYTFDFTNLNITMIDPNQLSR